MPKIKLGNTNIFRVGREDKGRACRGDQDVVRKVEGNKYSVIVRNLDRGNIHQYQRDQIRQSLKSQY